MRRLVGVLSICLAAAGAGVVEEAGTPAMPPAGDTSPVDYRDAARWICRPGNGTSPCTDRADAPSVDAARVGSAPGRAPIDCLYVYPTASLDDTYYSGLVPDAAMKAVVHAQAAWLGARCRVFAPIYHQVTIAGLKWELARTPDAITSEEDLPYRDILAAWRDYLARDNAGRGVVLIGHSQGSRMLQRLLAEEIDGKPAERLLVAAYLPGGQMDAKSFRHVAPCRSSGQTGCVVAWASYRDGYVGPRLFGRARPGVEPVCVNPAALAGGRGSLKPAIAGPADALPLVDARPALSAECETDAQGAVLRVRIEPGPEAARMDAALTPSRAGPAWGLHPHDLGLVRGNLLDLIESQSAAWARAR